MSLCGLRFRLLLCVLCMGACDTAKPASPPSAIAPAVTPQPLAQAQPVSPQPVVAEKTEEKARALPSRAESQTQAHERKLVALAEKKPKPSRPSEPAASASASPTTAPEPEPAKKVILPHTDHVHVAFPKGLQAWLDADTRMQPWVESVIRTIDDCYARERASNAAAAGTIEVAVSMHKDARPNADILALPPQLSGVVACATGGLMRSDMPLFCGNEGDRYTVRVTFER